MTDLIRQQLISGEIMLCCGLAAGFIWQVFSAVRRLRAKSSLSEFLLELIPMILIGYCITAFLYYSSWGKIAVQDVVCFAVGFWLWRNVYGKEGRAASGVREESQGTGHQYGTGSQKKEESSSGSGQ